MESLHRLATSFLPILRWARELPLDKKLKLLALGILLSFGSYLYYRKRALTDAKTTPKVMDLENEASKQAILAAFQKAEEFRRRKVEIEVILREKKEAFLAVLTKLNPELAKEIETHFQTSKKTQIDFLQTLSRFLKNEGVEKLLETTIEAAKKTTRPETEEEKAYEEFKKVKQNIQGREADWLLSLESSELFTYAHDLVAYFSQFCHLYKKADNYRTILNTIRDFKGVDPNRKKEAHDDFLACKRFEETFSEPIEGTSFDWKHYLSVHHKNLWKSFKGAISGNALSLKFVKAYVSGEIQRDIEKIKKIRQEELETAKQTYKNRSEDFSQEVDYPPKTREMAQKIRILFQEEKEFLQILREAKTFLPQNLFPENFFDFIQKVLNASESYAIKINQKFEVYFSQHFDKVDLYLDTIQRLIKIAKATN